MPAPLPVLALLPAAAPLPSPGPVSYTWNLSEEEPLLMHMTVWVSVTASLSQSSPLFAVTVPAACARGRPRLPVARVLHPPRFNPAQRKQSTV